MGDVEQLPVAANMIWVCNCGCSTFKLHGDGSAECAACETFTDGPDGAWFDPIRSGKPRDPEAPVPFADKQGNDSVDFARVLVQRNAAAEGVQAIMVHTADDRLSVWSAADTPEEIAEAVDVFRQGANLLAEQHLPGGGDGDGD